MSKEVGDKIKSIRMNLGKTLEEFGKLFDPPASKGVVSNWENGYNLPNNNRLLKIAKLGNVTVEELLGNDCEVCAGNYFRESWYPESQLELSPLFNVTEDKKLRITLFALKSNYLGFVDIDINYCPECGRRLKDEK